MFSVQVRFISNIKSQRVCVSVCLLLLFATRIQNNQTIKRIKYQPSGEGGARLPPATPHRLRAVRSTGKAQPEGRLGRFQVETGKKTALSNPLGVIVSAKRVKLQLGLVY